ncbi:hypothetical protein [Anaeroselena agilis]|uniref:Uncharacterized protein n=1 Tax=Anaeroselena agilis TaxID=3063788 RepID=A0ABU3NS98_9FIRM|nr:hypothetical protein [Selenomonadales bacterium 4137-cl]
MSDRLNRELAIDDEASGRKLLRLSLRPRNIMSKVTNEDMASLVFRHKADDGVCFLRFIAN